LDRWHRVSILRLAVSILRLGGKSHGVLRRGDGL
jgi:hypothetical protein